MLKSKLAAAATVIITLAGGTYVARAEFYNPNAYYNYSGYPYARYQRSYTPGRSPIARTVTRAPAGYGPNTIVISTSQRRLYYINRRGQAISYGIGVGRRGFAWSGVTRVSAKKAWPGWTPPSQMRKRQPGLPAYMPGGINNPLGARALYLGSTLYRIHGSNEPETIGRAVSSGCFRMTNEDVIDLYSRVSVGTKVIVLR